MVQWCSWCKGSILKCTKYDICIIEMYKIWNLCNFEMYKIWNQVQNMKYVYYWNGTLVQVYMCFLRRLFDVAKTHLSPSWLRLLSVIRRLFCCCWFIVDCCSRSLCSYVFRPSFLCSTQCLSSYAMLPFFNRLSVLLWMLVLCVSSSRCHGLVYSVWLWYCTTHLFFANNTGTT